MAIIKHRTSKNARYTDVLEYYSYKHQEDSRTGHYEPILDEYGLLQERENCAIVCLDPYGRDADPRKWSLNCLKTNGRFGKNREKTDRKQHQYILSHPEEDRSKMTMEDLLEEGKAFARENLQGYDVLIAVHRDTDNDHIHLAINSVRAAEREPQSWMMKSDDGSIRRSEVCAGGKHQDSPEFRSALFQFSFLSAAQNSIQYKGLQSGFANRHWQNRLVWFRPARNAPALSAAFPVLPAGVLFQFLFAFSKMTWSWLLSCIR